MIITRGVRVVSHAAAGDDDATSHADRVTCDVDVCVDVAGDVTRVSH